MSTLYYRPIVQCDAARPDSALPLAGGPLWFDHVEVLSREQTGELMAARALPSIVRARLTTRPTPVAGLTFSQPRIMAVLNTTPDSFSDGGDHAALEDALIGANRLIAEGADMLDIGGESTRPGADFIPSDVEIERTVPVIESLADTGVPISIDTRKADVARAAFKAGAMLFNDVSALSFDPESLEAAATLGAPVCLMHAMGDPKTMQKNPSYDNVLLDVFDYLQERIDMCVAAGIKRENIIVDPGIGFGKTLEHNLTLIRGLSLFHALGCPILLGVSRKRFIGTLGNAPDAKDRAPGSIALALEGLRQGVQMLRVHDIKETKQAIALWGASRP